MRKSDGLLACLVLLTLMAVAAHLTREQDVVSGFADVIDGDSLWLEGREIRLSGIDAPELRQTCVLHEQAYPCGEIARNALQRMLAGHLVTCRISGHDRYGRNLAACEVGGEDIGATLVSRGFALAYGRYETEEAAARKQKLELWAGSFERPSEWRKAHSNQGRS